MKHHRWITALFVIALVTGIGVTVAVSAGETVNVPRMTSYELKAMLESPELFIIDARTGSSWDDAKFKIKGAVRKDPEKHDWMDQLPHDKTMVLYCT